MKTTIVVAPGVAQVVDQTTPTVGPNDVLVKVRACGICGTDAFFLATGGLPPHLGAMPIGHEPAGEVVEVGGNLSDVSVGIMSSSTPWAGARLTGSSVAADRTAPFRSSCC